MNQQFSHIAIFSVSRCYSYQQSRLVVASANCVYSQCAGFIIHKLNLAMRIAAICYTHSHYIVMCPRRVQNLITQVKRKKPTTVFSESHCVMVSAYAYLNTCLCGGWAPNGCIYACKFHQLEEMCFVNL